MASTIKVDNVQNQPGTNIINKCGTTITLGASSDTVALAAGASQTGFGRTGTVDWVTTPKVTGDSPITAVTGKGYFLNTTAGEITINLPAGAAGSIVSMADYAGTWQTNKVTVAPNGAEKIGGTANNTTLDTEGQSVTFVYVDSTQGWVNTMDSTSNVRGATYMTASVSGACNTLATAPDCADVKIATFLGPGTFTVCTTSNIADNNLVSYMVLAGGGGASIDNAGGGGAGGFREVKGPLTPYTASPLDGYPTAPNRITVTATGFPITIGGGGTAGSPSPPLGTKGADSVFSTITSTGGGYGGTNPAVSAGPGGSGGGGGLAAGPGSQMPGGSGNTPLQTPSQGNDGGLSGYCTSGPGNGGGGGGGAGGVGGPFTPCTPPTPGGGAGAVGVTTSISASPVAYAGGGGGAAGGSVVGGGGSPCGSGGYGGGNPPAPAVRTGAPPSAPSSASSSGAVNRGGGGGAINVSGTAGGGGSGVVIIRYRFQ